MASFISIASTTATPSLVARMSIPMIGEVPDNDPIVRVSIAILLSMIVLAFFLVFWTQRRSAKEVWASVKNTGQFKHLRNSSHFPIDSERPSWDASSEMEEGQVRISHKIPMADSEYGSDIDDDDDEISAEEGDLLATAEAPRCLQFSDPPQALNRNFTRTPPLAGLDGFERVFDEFQASKMVDAEDSDLGVNFKRASMSARQLREMHLGGH